MTRVLVTGGSGMVGEAIKRLIPSYDDMDFIFLSSHDCDLRNRDETIKIFKEIAPIYCIHLAAIVGGLFHNIKEKVGFLRDNIRINENVLEACHLANIQKGIFCLSSCIFPAEPKSFPMSIEDLHSGPPHESNYSYATAKRVLELECRNYNQQYGRQYICVVPVNLFGENDNYHLQNAHIVPSIMHKIYLAKKNNTPLTALGSGKPLRQFLYAGDFARIMMWALLNYEDTKPIICCDQEYTIDYIIRLIAKCMNFDGEIIYDHTASDGIYQKTVSNEYLLSLIPDFSFTPLEEAMQRSAEWLLYNYEVARK